MGNVALDSLAAICAAERGDSVSVVTLINSLEPSEVGEFIAATVAHAGHILTVAAHAAGVSPDRIAGAVAATIREDCANAQD